MTATWQPPTELARSRPRFVVLTGAGQTTVAFVVALLLGALAAGLGLYLAAERARGRRESVERNGVIADAEVVELLETRRKEKRYTVVYRYNAGTRAYDGRARVGRAYWRALQVGSRIPVRYLPGAPEESWIRGREPKGVPYWVVPLGPAGLVLAAWALAWRLRRQRELLSEGRPALARVTHSKKVVHQHGHLYRVYYQFQMLSGATRTGQFDVSRKPPPAGATLTIVYDPDDPDRQARYPLSLVRVGYAPLLH